MTVRKRNSMFAPVAEPVHAPVDTSFTGRLSATWEQLGTTSNLAQMSRLNRERQRDDDVEVPEHELLSGLPQERYAEVLQEAATYGNRAALMLRDQLSEDLKNTRIMDEMPWYASMGYGLTTALDPMFLVPGGQAVKGAQVAGKAVGQVTKSAITRMGVNSSLVETGTAWVAGAGMESVLYNSPRLGGDHLYNQKDFINDVMLETVMGAGLGLTLKGASVVRTKQRARHQQKMEDLQKATAQRERELAGDWSDFDLSANTKELNRLYGDKTMFADNTAKWQHEALLQEVDSLNKAIDKVQGLQGDAGRAAKSVFNDEVEALLERMAYHNKTPEDAISMLDTVIDLNKRISNLSGDYKSIASLEGQHATAVIRNVMKDSLDTTLEAVVGNRNATKLTKAQASKIVSMDMRGRVKDAMSATITMMGAKVKGADEVALELARMHLFYNKKIPSTRVLMINAAIPDIMSGRDLTELAGIFRRINETSIPQDIVGYEFKPATLDFVPKADGTVKNVRTGNVPVSVIRDVLDGLKNTDEHARLMESMKGSKAVFGNINDDAIEVTEEVSNVVGSKLFSESMNRLTATINKYSVGEMHLVDHASKGADFVATLGHYAGRAFGLTRDMSSALKESGSTTLHYIGSRFTEIGKGYGGSMQRKHTAAVIKEAELTKSLSQILPQYYQYLEQWVARKGKSKIAQYNAANKTGVQNELANQFNREFMSIMNKLNLGKQVDIPETMKPMVDDWNKYMSYNHDKLVSNGIEGFTAERKVSNYVPQVWVDGRMRDMIKDGKESQLMGVLTAGYRSAGTPDPEGAATALLKWVKEGSDIKELADDQFMPRVDSRAQVRTAIDWDAEFNGMKVMDLLDTEVPAMATKYSNRMSGWIGIAKASDNLVRSGVDLNALREMVRAETSENRKALAMHDDVFDLLFGRPTRGGLPEWARNLKELAVLSRMGGLGSAQLAETGVVATRAIMEATQDSKFIMKLLKNSRPEDTYTDLLEMTKLTGYDKDYALLNRQSVNLDVAEGRMDGEQLRNFNKLSDVLTFGSAKATGSRALGQVTGYNAIRKYQSFVAQRSFGMAVARHFKYGTSKLTPARLADYGLTDIKGNNRKLKEMFDTHVMFDDDGYPISYNFDKWDTDALDQFRYATQRMEATTQARALVGELPVWMNKPAMGVLMQFRQMGITTQNKTLARNAAFGDKEAMTEFTLATMSASAVRAAKVYGLAAAATALRSDTSLDAELSKRQQMAEHMKLLPFGADMYINHLGMYADVYNTSSVIGQVVSGDEPEKLYSQVPMFGLIGSMYRTGEAVIEGDVDKAIQNAKGMAILGNTFMVDAFADALDK